MKDLTIKNNSDAEVKIPDLTLFGKDVWVLISKASSVAGGWMKSTKAMNVPGGIVVQVTTQQHDNVAEALAFVPGSRVVGNGDSVSIEPLG